MRSPQHFWRVLFPLTLITALGCAVTPLQDKPAMRVAPAEMSDDEWRVLDHVFVVTDGSGTMYLEETFPDAKALSVGFIRAMPERSARAANPGTYQAGAIGFGGEERVVAPLGDFDRAALESKAQEFKVMGTRDGRGGQTPYRHVFAEIGQALQGERGRAAVVIFSDGVPDFPRDALRAATNLAAGHPDGVCFHGVQTGESDAGREFLTSLSQVTNCGSVRAAGQVQTASAMQSFAHDVFSDSAPALPSVAAAPPGCGTVRLRGVNFGFDRDEVSAESAVILEAAAQELARCGTLGVQVNGHTDSTGPEQYNEGLSKRRADNVRYFLSTKGIEVDRMQVNGFGESKPIAPNDTPDNRALNRRVELVPAQ